MKTWAKVAVAAIILVLGFQTYRSCRALADMDKYWVSREEYDQAVKDMSAGLQETFRIIGEKDKLLAMQDQFVADGQRKIMELEDTLEQASAAGRDLLNENARLKHNAQAVIDSNPAVKALVENYDLRCANYEKQIFTLVAQGQEKDKVIEAQGVEIVTIKFQRDTWKKQFDESERLRGVSDMLRMDLEKRYKTDKFWSTLGKWGPPAAFVLGLVLGK